MSIMGDNIKLVSNLVDKTNTLIESNKRLGDLIGDMEDDLEGIKNYGTEYLDAKELAENY